MQVPGVDFTESFSQVASDISKRIIIEMNLYQEEEGCVAEIFHVEAAFLNLYMQVYIFIEWTEHIVDLGIITN